MGLVERSVQTLKEILNKEGNNLSQLRIAEMVFAINSREQQDQGSAITRSLGSKEEICQTVWIEAAIGKNMYKQEGRKDKPVSIKRGEQSAKRKCLRWGKQ